MPCLELGVVAVAERVCHAHGARPAGVPQLHLQQRLPVHLGHVVPVPQAVLPAWAGSAGACVRNQTWSQWRAFLEKL